MGFHRAHVFDHTTNRQINGYIENIAMTPIKFRFKISQHNQIHSGDHVSTDVMNYGILTVKPYGQKRKEAILVNPNLI